MALAYPDARPLFALHTWFALFAILGAREAARAHVAHFALWAHRVAGVRAPLRYPHKTAVSELPLARIALIYRVSLVLFDITAIYTSRR